MPENIETKIMNLKKEYLAKYGKAPTNVHIPQDEEDDLIILDYNKIGEMAGKIFLNGARVALRDNAGGNGKICGLNIIWDAKKLEVD